MSAEKKTKSCPVCTGTGGTPDEHCHRCKGTGVVAIQADTTDPAPSGPPPDGGGGSTGQ